MSRASAGATYLARLICRTVSISLCLAYTHRSKANHRLTFEERISAWVDGNDGNDGNEEGQENEVTLSLSLASRDLDLDLDLDLIWIRGAGKGKEARPEA